MSRYEEVTVLRKGSQVPVNEDDRGEIQALPQISLHTTAAASPLPTPEFPPIHTTRLDVLKSAVISSLSALKSSTDAVLINSRATSSSISSAFKMNAATDSNCASARKPLRLKNYSSQVETYDSFHPTADISVSLFVTFVQP